MNELSHKQQQTITAILCSCNYTKSIEKAGISRKTFYEWLKQPEFKGELDNQREEIASEAFGVLSQGLTKAVETLIGLLYNNDDRLKRLVAKDIIDFIIRHKENEDLDKRLKEIEKRLAEKKY